MQSSKYLIYWSGKTKELQQNKIKPSYKNVRPISTPMYKDMIELRTLPSYRKCDG